MFPKIFSGPMASYGLVSMLVIAGAVAAIVGVRYPDNKQGLRFRSGQLSWCFQAAAGGIMLMLAIHGLIWQDDSFVSGNGSLMALLGTSVLGTAIGFGLTSQQQVKHSHMQISYQFLGGILPALIWMILHTVHHPFSEFNALMKFVDNSI